ncbi:MAG: TIGR03557 family F420-dependent LLM class oxidoreductase [Chloroflexota bacterium]
MATQQLLNNGPFSGGGDVPVGFVLSHEQFPVPQLVELGAAAEEAGFNAVWGSDHFQPWQSNQGHAGLVWATLAALSQRTRRVALGTGVTCPTYRYEPAIVAQAFATLGQLAPGRIFLGTGSGEAINEQAVTGKWDPYKVRVAMLVEAVQVIRKLWSGDTIEHNGEYYTVHARLYDIPTEPVPLYIAAGGPKSMELAGEHGDGLVTDAKGVQEQEMRSAYQKGAQAGGKDSKQLPVLIEQMMVVGDEQDARKGAELWRFMPRSWEEYVNNPDPADIARRAHQDVPIEDVITNWVISKDPQAHIQRIRELLDAGATQVFVHSPQPDQKAIVDFFGREVLPKI